VICFFPFLTALLPRYDFRFLFFPFTEQHDLPSLSRNKKTIEIPASKEKIVPMKNQRIIQSESIAEAVKKLCIESNIHLPADTSATLESSIRNERSPLGKSILSQCAENAAIARNGNIPICQDTGLAVFFIELGDSVSIENGTLYAAVNEGVRRGYGEGFLRKSVLADPLYDRKNTGDNTPAIIHLEIVPGDGIRITIAPKGGGAENMSALCMLPPSAGEKGVIDFVVKTVTQAGGNPCPPTVIGVGIGGNFERCAYLAKRALIRPLGKPSADPRYAALEAEILRRINASGIGPQGLGGDTTSFAVNVEFEPCHLASLPVAVNINCHVHRHSSVTL
jgi:fumarate hydratase subunit alpha